MCRKYHTAYVGNNKMGDGEIIFLSYGDICFGGSSGGVDIWTYDEFLACIWNLCISDRCGQS